MERAPNPRKPLVNYQKGAIGAMSPSNRRRSVMLVAIAGYIATVVTAIVIGNAALSAFSTLILLTLVLAPSLRDGRLWAWIAWATIIVAVLALTLSGHGTLAFDAVPILINLALAIFSVEHYSISVSR